MPLTLSLSPLKRGEGTQLRRISEEAPAVYQSGKPMRSPSPRLRGEGRGEGHL